MSVRKDNNFSFFSNPYHLQCEESIIPSKLGNMRPSGYYVRGTKAMNPRSLVHSSGKELSPPTNVKQEVTQVQIKPSGGDYETTDAAVLVSNFELAHYGHKDSLLRVHPINDPDIPLHDTSDAHVLSPVQFFQANGLDHTRETNFVTTTATATRSGTCEGAPSGAPLVHDEAASVVLLNRRHWLQALPDFQNAANVARVEAF